MCGISEGLTTVFLDFISGVTQGMIAYCSRVRSNRNLTPQNPNQTIKNFLLSLSMYYRSFLQQLLAGN